MNADVIIININEIVTPYLEPPVKGQDLSKLLHIQNAFIAIKDQKIIDFGNHDFQDYITNSTKIYDASGKLALPGLIDSHTHLVHGGSRENEFTMKIEGVPYLDILKQGGGILSTVKATRNATPKELFDKALKSLDKMLSFGVTTIEAKSGYGLELDTEIKQLEVAHLLEENHPIDISHTYLGAHAFPSEYLDKKEVFVDQILTDLEVIEKLYLASHVDVFCEDHVFTLEQTSKILNKAKELGFGVRIHADEIVALHGARLAAELEASSADHLMAASKEDISLLGKTNTVCNLLPSTSFYLNKDYADARFMIQENCAIAISSDYNPGSSPSENFQFTMQLAANKLRMTPSEIINASTINPAYHLGLSNKVGSIAIGKFADIILLDVPNIDYMFYHFGINHVSQVFKKGVLVVENK